jgi:flagellar hook-associated protein 2
VTRDYAAVVTAVQDFVSAYNSFVEFAKGQLTHDPASGGTKPPLHAQSTLRNMHSQFRVLVTQAVPGLAPEMDSLWKIGISTGAVGSISGRDAKLEVDETQLKAALAQDIEGVMKLMGAFEGTGGVSGGLLDYAKIYTTSRTGLLDNKNQSLEQEMRFLGRQVDTATDRLAHREEFLYRKFSNMERALSSLQTQSNWLTAQLSQLSSWRPVSRR